MRSALVLVCIAVFAVATTRAADSTSRTGTVEKITVHGASLEGNLEGDSADRAVFVYLPPSYKTAPTRRYPVVYLLHGYGLTGERWMSFAKLAEGADTDIANGTMREMILVNPDAFTKYDGSMYSSSPTTGDWETFIAQDLVKYIDSHYRTIATRASRGLGGHSMGGYGTIRIGMKRPDVFSSLYIMSACCLLTDPGAARGRAAGDRGTATSSAEPPARGAAPSEGRTQGAARGRGNGFGNAQAAQAAAWAPNPTNPPLFYDLPVKDGEVQPLVRAKFLANSPLAMVDQYVTGLKKYQAIAQEVGTQDTLAESNRQLDRELTAVGVQHTFETYEGDHTNRVVERIAMKVLPFFSQQLSFGKSTRATATR